MALELRHSVAMVLSVSAESFPKDNATHEF